MSRLIDLSMFWRDRPDLKQKNKECGILGIVWPNLAIGAMQQPAQCISGDDYDFVITSMIGNMMVVATSNYIGTPMQARLYNQSLSRNIDNTIIDWACTLRVGTRDDDSPMPYPIVLPANSQFVISLSNFTGAVVTAWVALHGIKCYRNHPDTGRAHDF